MASCNFIQPVPSQILTAFTRDKQPVHIELDSNATVNYITLVAAKSFGFHISPNSQLSVLADGITKLPAIGEINEIFSRNEWTVSFKAVVVHTLHTQLIGGTVFLKENAIKQDFVRNTIQVHGKYTVLTTSPAFLLPIQPLNQLCKIAVNKTLLPGQNVAIPVPFSDQAIVAVEPAYNSKSTDWPIPQLCTVKKGEVTLTNGSSKAVILGKDIKTIQVRATAPFTPHTTSIRHTISLPRVAPSSPQVEFCIENVPEHVVTSIQQAHTQFSAVFDKDLTGGYNGAFGPHVCHLNWAGDTRPTADQVRMVSYSHDLKQLHQAVCDELTDQQVLGIPQENNVTVQFVCPSFLRRKPKAKSKPNHLLTKDDVRLVVNFSPINDHLKNIPSVKTTPNDIMIALGRWKCLIIFDLHQGFFQNHMDPESHKWLGVATPFGGIRFIRRSGQGLLGQSEELEELLTKILKEELEAGHCCKIADDVFIGAQTYEQAADIYITVLGKLHKANLKVSATKTHIFPKTADILGWKWQEGSKLLPSPHRQLALKNTKQENIDTIKDLRSWVGLYKTLLIATPNLATIMDPFDKEAANKESKDRVDWTPDLATAFRDAKNHIDNIKELYLPSPEDQLLLVPDGSQKIPGIGHVLYALVDGHRKPVRYHSVKLPDNCTKWSPCEIEALAFATAIQTEMDIIKESKQPLLIAPDSSPVKDAVNLIKKGKFSASARMNSFITNINRVPVEVIHVSGKANLNAVGDMQSRNPSICSADVCSVCNFVKTSIGSVINPNASLGAIGAHSLYNSKSWAAAQHANAACRTAISHLRTGKQPSKKTGSIFTEIRRYCTICKINRDGCLIVPQTRREGQPQQDKIVIPTPLLPSLIWHIHNNENHPAKTQLKASFDRMFYGILVQQVIDQVYQDCFQCKAMATLPVHTSKHTACTEVHHPGQYFHADIIKREKQKIFLIRDNFSSLVAASFVDSEQKEELKVAIVNLTTTIRTTPNITVRVDNATGFQALKRDPELDSLGITLEFADTHNKNSNAVVDRACSEIEAEINKLQPQGGQITSTTLAQAVLLLNRKLRRQEKLSAMEIHFARDQTTQVNLNLDDIQLRDSQLAGRKLDTNTKPVSLIKQGDTVVTTEKGQKHMARDVFLVTHTDEHKVSMQKIGNPFTKNITLRSKVHTTTSHLLRPIYSPKHLTIPISAEPQRDDQVPKQRLAWSPFNPQYYCQAEEDDDQEEALEPQNLAPPILHDQDIPLEPHNPEPVVQPAQLMLEWIEHQRASASTARTQGQNAILSFVPPPHPTPPPRASKLAALQALRQKGPKLKTRPIPQLEGAEPTPDTTPDPTPDPTPNASFTTDIHHLSPGEPWSPHNRHHPWELSEGDLDGTYQRHLEDPWEWDNLQQELSFLHSPEPFPENNEDNNCLSFPSLRPQRRHTFNGFVLPFTFKKPRSY
jgi:hypothetical protein